MRQHIERSTLVTLALVSFVGIVGAAASSPLERHEYRKLVMGVEARIVLYTPDEASGRAAAAAAFARMEALDEMLSDYKRESELSRLSRASGGDPVAVSPELFDLLDHALAFSRLSDGAFDVTVGPLVQLVREAQAGRRFPGPDALRVAKERVGWQHVRLDAEAVTVALELAGMQLDVGAIGKGFACDEALRVLYRMEHPRALIELGGDLRVGEPPPGERGWRVLAGCEADADLVELLVARQGIATSGEYLRYTPYDGRDFHYVVDPSSPFGVATRPRDRCYTAIAADGTTADAMATIANVVGGERASELAQHVPGTRIVELRHDVIALFDGRTLRGWTTRGGRYDGDAEWGAEAGAIVGRLGPDGQGGLLYTEGEFGSFELELDTKIDRPADSGVFLRMVPRERDLKGAQVTLDHRPDGEIAAIYADGFLAHNTEAALLEGEWNHLRIRCTGFDMRVQVWLNGTRVTDYTLPPGTPGFASSGRVGLQVHEGEPGSSGDIRFRNLTLRELPMFTDVWDPASEVRLLAEDSLDGWERVGAAEGYTVERGVLAIPAEGGAGHLRTVDDYRDFRLRLDFKLARMANSGVFLRGARTDEDPAYSGCEVQILDDFHWEETTGTTLEPYQFTGSLYASVPPGDRGALRPIGQWNTFEILYRGSRLAVALNDRVLYDVDTLAVPGKPFAERAPTGFVGLQRYDAPTEGDTTIWFRRIAIQPEDAR